MAARPRLLFLSQTLPSPAIDGVTLRTNHTLRILAGMFDIDAVCFRRHRRGFETRDVERAETALGELASVASFPIPQQHGKGARFVWDHLRSVGTRRVYTYYVYESGAVAERVDELLHRNSYDLFHIDTLDLSRYLGRLDPGRTVCVHHNVESELLRRRAARETSRVRSTYLRHQARLMEDEERRWCRRLGANVAVSGPDARVLETRGPGGRYWVLPNGVDVEEFRPGVAGPDEGAVVFVGGTTWFPNRDAMDFFRDDILPLMRADGCDARVQWIGHATDDEVETLSEPDLTLTGFVPDIRPYLERAACYVVPLRIGGGTRLKILHAWAMGNAVVSTSLGCEGLRVADGSNILVRDDPAEFAAAVGRVLRDSELRDRLGRAGRRTVEESYSWEVIGRDMSSRYATLLADPGARSPVASAPS